MVFLVAMGIAFCIILFASACLLACWITEWALAKNKKLNKLDARVNDMWDRFENMRQKVNSKLPDLNLYD